MTTPVLDFRARYLYRVDADDFGAAFEAARTESPRVAAATSDFADDGATLYWASADGRSGFAVRDSGELVYVFSLESGRGDAIVRAAIDRGATRLDCFDGFLVGFYARHGFVETAREPNWTPGGPDVVWMARTS